MTVEETVEVVRAPRRRTPRAKAAAAIVEQPAATDAAEQTPEAPMQAGSEPQFVEPAQAIVAPALVPEAVGDEPTEPGDAATDHAVSRPEAQTPSEPVAAIAEFALPEVSTSAQGGAAAADPTTDGRSDAGPRPRGRDGRGRRERGPRPAPGDRANGAERFGTDVREGRDGRDGRQGGFGQPRSRNGGPYGGTATPARTGPPHLTVPDLEAKSAEELAEMARELEIPTFSRLPKQEQMVRLLQAQTEKDGQIFGDGVLEIIEDGFGFLRGQRFLPGPDDIYVSQSQIRRFGLRTGDRVVRPGAPAEGQREVLQPAARRGGQRRRSRRRRGAGPTSTR